MSTKYYIITYGCQMNKSGSERIATILEGQGYKPAQKESEADLVLINMCSVRQSAVDRVYGQIKNLTKLKKKEPKLQTVLTGCILKRDKRKFREVLVEEDKSSSPPTESHLRDEGGKERKAFFDFAAARVFDEIWDSKQFLECKPRYPANKQAFVPISNGCDNFCSYCVVPLVRGPLVCRDHKKIVKEVKLALKRGQKEIWLLGQNVNDYQSPTNPSINFPELLQIINNIPGQFSIRFTSPHPKNFSDELIEVMAKSEKVAKYINLPVQSGDNTILKRMNRPYTVSQYKTLVKKIRKAMPDVNLSTDIIVGFPGETKTQFQNTEKLFREMKFNMAYIAKYSPRPGTTAFKLKNNVSLEEKKRREKILRGIFNKKSF